jgi:AbrB family looped-hinge helix DNA binding protein
MSVYKIHPEDLITSKIDGKGRITIPKEVREEWQLESGDRIEFAIVESENGSYVCDGCGGHFDLPEVFVNRTKGTVKCSDCMTPEDRIVD